MNFLSHTTGWNSTAIHYNLCFIFSFVLFNKEFMAWNLLPTSDLIDYLWIQISNCGIFGIQLLFRTLIIFSSSGKHQIFELKTVSKIKFPDYNIY